jgi:hypothetical protein
MQDRLPKELRLAGINDIDEANRFIRDVYVPCGESGRDIWRR